MKKYNLLGVGIQVNRELEEHEKSYISNFVADILRRKYPYLSCNYLDIVTMLYNTQMYVVEDKVGLSSVNYIYQDKSIYYSCKKDLNNIDELILHECIHKIQDKRDKHNKLMQMGNCEFTLSKVKGLYFNEAAIQYIVLSLLNKKSEIVEYRGIKLKNYNSSYCSLITNLIYQIMLLVNEENILVRSTIEANNDFNYKMIDYFGEKEFYKIRDNFDKIAEYQFRNDINDVSENLINTYKETTKIIAENYFTKCLKYVDKLDEIKELKNKLNKYIEYIEIEKKKDENEIYNSILSKILEKETELKNKYALVVVKNGILKKAFMKIKEILGIDYNDEY